MGSIERKHSSPLKSERLVLVELGGMGSPCPETPKALHDIILAFRSDVQSFQKQRTSIWTPTYEGPYHQATQEMDPPTPGASHQKQRIFLHQVMFEYCLGELKGFRVEG